jgi:ABC-type antimicrobial peptide transport system permease subunit
VFFPFFESEGSSGTFYVKVRGTPESFVPSLRAIVHGVDPTLAMTDFRTVNEQLNRSLNTEHLLATLSGSFGTLALLLSLVGLYGVMSFVVTQRTREIGIRLALGATRWSAIRLVLQDASAMILTGIGIGLLFVLALGRLVQAQLYDVKSFDPTAIIITVLILCSAGLGAALIPAHRASGVSPTDALRVE